MDPDRERAEKAKLKRQTHKEVQTKAHTCMRAHSRTATPNPPMWHTPVRACYVWRCILNSILLPTCIIPLPRHLPSIHSSRVPCVSSERTTSSSKLRRRSCSRSSAHCVMSVPRRSRRFLPNNSLRQSWVPARKIQRGASASRCKTRRGRRRIWGRAMGRTMRGMSWRSVFVGSQLVCMWLGSHFSRGPLFLWRVV